MTPERAAELYRTADTPQKAAELIAARGRPGLAAMVLHHRIVPPAQASAQLFRAHARHVVLGTATGWFERGEVRSEKAIRQLEAIFLWLGDVFTRYAPLQPPPPDEPIVLACETCGKPLAPGRDCCPPPRVIPAASKKRRRKNRP